MDGRGSFRIAITRINMRTDFSCARKMKSIWIPQAVAAAMLLLALTPDMPYGYYVLLRWIMCGILAFLAFVALERKKSEWVWILGIAAAIYNPFVTIHLGKEIWSIANVITIVVVLVSVSKLKERK